MPKFKNHHERRKTVHEELVDALFELQDHADFGVDFEEEMNEETDEDTKEAKEVFKRQTNEEETEEEEVTDG